MTLFLSAGNAFGPADLFAQSRVESQVPAPQTKLESVLVRRGTILLKDFQEIGRLQCARAATLDLTAISTSDPGAKTPSVKGIKITIDEGERNKGEQSVFLDVDEIDSLLKAFKFFASTAKQWSQKAREYSEAIYVTKGDFAAGFYQKGTDQGGFARAGSYSKSHCFFEMATMGDFEKLLQSGITALRK
jgi:hypothetical protein